MTKSLGFKISRRLVRVPPQSACACGVLLQFHLNSSSTLILFSIGRQQTLAFCLKSSSLEQIPEVPELDIFLFLSAFLFKVNNKNQGIYELMDLLESE